MDSLFDDLPDPVVRPDDPFRWNHVPVTQQTPDEPPANYDPEFGKRVTPIVSRRDESYSPLMKVNKKTGKLRFENPVIEHLAQQPRQELLAAMLRTESPRIRRFLRMVFDPAHKTKSMTRIAAICGITPMEMQNLWREYKLDKALMVWLEGMPTVAADVLLDAQSTDICCPRCDGAGHIIIEEAKRKCPQCKGAGTIRKIGDSHARELIMEKIGWRKSGGTQINIDNRRVQVESVIEELERSRQPAIQAQLPDASGPVVDVLTIPQDSD